LLGLPFPASAHQPTGVDKHLAHEDLATAARQSHIL